MDENVCPASKTVFRGILPCLESRAMGEVVQRFPVIESFVTILDGSVGCSKNVS